MAYFINFIFVYVNTFGENTFVKIPITDSDHPASIKYGVALPIFRRVQY